VAGHWRGVPSTAELAEAVREFLERDVLPSAEGRTRFLTRVAINVVATIERELALGPAAAEAHTAALHRLGVSSDAGLCGAIRDGSLDERYDEVIAVTRENVIAKLRVANPRYLRGEDQA
jgi:Domain of unknown function (DUF6285)